MIPLDAAKVNRTIFRNHSVQWYYVTRIEDGDNKSSMLTLLDDMIIRKIYISRVVTLGADVLSFSHGWLDKRNARIGKGSSLLWLKRYEYERMLSNNS